MWPRGWFMRWLIAPAASELIYADFGSSVIYFSTSLSQPGLTSFSWADISGLGSSLDVPAGLVTSGLVQTDLSRCQLPVIRPSCSPDRALASAVC